MGQIARLEDAVEYVWRPQVGPQKALVDCPISEVFFGGSRGGGKGLSLDVELPTPRGFTRMGDIAVGDTLFDKDGARCSVIWLAPIVQRPCYRLIFDDGSSIVADDVHRWLTTTASDRREGRRASIRDTLAIHKTIGDVHGVFVGGELEDGGCHYSFVTEPGMRRILSVCEMKTVPTRCISVDSPSNTFLVGRSFIPTLNTDGVLGKWALEEQKYGPAFNARMFRRTVTSSEDAIARSKQIYGALGGKFREDKSFWKMPNGGRVGFTYLDSVDDANAQQGKNLTHAWIEEVGQYPGPEPIDRLFGALRSANKVPVQMILTGNPGGVGQHWIAKRYGMIPFPRRPKIVSRLLPDGSTHLMAVIPSRITDNKILLESDPTYINRLQLVGSAALVRAWLEGDWSAIEGAFFPEWSDRIHILPPFQIPDGWLRFRSADWGSARPFSIGWWAVVSDDLRRGPIDGLDIVNKDGQGLGIIPRGALIRYREWYGASAPNVGLKLPPEDVADGILAREIHEPRNDYNEPDITYGVLDPAAFASDGGPSIAERMAMNGVRFNPADNKRVGTRGAMGGWDLVRKRLIGTAQRNLTTNEIDWATGSPMMYMFSNCRDLARTLPALQHDKARAEDVDSSSEDHAPDECRYACSSRPWIEESHDKPPAKGLAQATLDDMWEIAGKARRGARI